MSEDSTIPNPTPGELEILRVLWSQGPSTVREVQSKLPVERAAGYTTVLKLLQIMTEKGLVDREEASKAHVYRARQSQDQAQRQIVTDVLDRVFGGAAERLVMHALTSRKASQEELAEIRILLDKLEREEP